MHVMAGLYLSGDMEGNNDEINAVKPIVERYGDIIDAIVVANEVRLLSQSFASMFI